MPSICCLPRWISMPVMVAAIFFLTPQPVRAQSLQTLQHHVVPAVASGQAVPAGSLPAQQRLSVSIVLPLRNQSQLTDLLSRLSDPTSPDYRHFLTVDQFTEQFGPTAEDYQSVVDFARAHGLSVTDAPANRMLVPVSGSVAQFEAAFHVSMKVYRHPTENRTFYSPDREPSLELNVPVAHIGGLNNYSIPRPQVKKASAAQALSIPATGSGPDGSYLPGDMRTAYYGSGPLTGKGQVVGLMEFDGYYISDVTASFAGAATSSTNGSNYVLAYTPTAGGVTYNIPVNNVLLGGIDSGAPVYSDDGEQVLDIAQAVGMAPGLSQVRVYIGYSDMVILNAMAAENVAKLLSISWLWQDDSVEVESFFQEFAAQGQSVFAASGDSAAFDPANGYFYPAEDAWVTAVGGTDLTTDGARGSWALETAWPLSTGGVSPDNVPLPSYQAGVANTSNGGSTTVRNVPDVAAEANYDNYSCEMGVCQGGWAGTSFAAPRWAAFMALVNEQAEAAGNSPIGFVNPALYALGNSSNYNTCFHDISSGNNDVSAPVIGFSNGYNAVSGYDLVTGWGSPTGQKLIDALAPPVAFQLLAAPQSLTISSGSAGTATITINGQAGFSGKVTFAVTSALPSGVTASFAPNPTTGSTLLTFTVSNSAVHGSYLLTITGTSGTVTETTSLVLAVTAPSITLYTNPTALKIGPGLSATTFVLVNYTSGSYSGMTFAVTSGLPSGVTATFGTSLYGETLTFSAANSAAPETSMVTITGTSGAWTSSTEVALTVLPPLFYLNYSPLPFDLVQGGSTTTAVTIVPWGNFSGPVTLYAPVLPSGVKATFNPNPATTTSILTMTAGAAAPVGTFPVELDGATAAGFTMDQFQQTITAAPQPTFNLNISPFTLALTQGASATVTVAVTESNGATGSVYLWDKPETLPVGVTATFNPSSTSGASVLTLTATPWALPGFYIVEIGGTFNNKTEANFLFLTVNQSSGFTLGASPASLTIAPGASVTDTITVIPRPGFAGSVNLAVTSAPSGITASFGANPTSGTSVLTLKASSLVLPGQYVVTIVGTSGADTVYTSQTLNVVDASRTLSMSATGYTFPNPVLVSNSDMETVVTLAAVGGSFTLGPFAITGTDAGAFKIQGTCGSVLTSKSCPVTVTFAPPDGQTAATQTYNATLVINDATVTGPHLFPLTATGWTPTVAVSPTSLSFGTQGVGTTSAAQTVTFTVGNQAGGKIAFFTKNITGADAGAFAESDNCGWGQNAGGQCTFRVTFTPTAAGSQSATLIIGDTGANAPHSVTLSGIGADAGPAMDLFPVSLNFGTLAMGSSSAAETVTLTNMGNLALSITGIAIAGANPGSFKQTNTCGSSVAAGANCTISVTFAPVVAAARSASLTITDNAAGSPHSVALSGTGASWAVALSATSLSFGYQTTGSPSAAQAITLTNTGTAAVALDGIAITGADTGSFSETNTCEGMVPVGQSCTISVTFTPWASGSQSASLTITDDAANSPQNVALSGTGAAPIFTMSPASLSFGTQAVGTRAAQTVTLTNTGAVPVIIVSVFTGGAYSGWFSATNACGSSVAVGKSCTFSVIFIPSGVGSVQNTTLTVVTNGSWGIVPLSGTGVLAAPALSPATLSFGAQAAGTTSSAQTVTLTNNGAIGLSISGIAIAGANPGSFTQTNTCGTWVAGKASCTISVKFAPVVSALRSGSLTITDNASGGSQNVALSGTGTLVAPSLSPASVSFGSQAAGTTSSAQTVTLKNNGAVALGISSIGIAGNNPGSFTQTNTCGATVAAGASCTISVKFAPVVSAPRSGSLTITDNASSGSQNVALSGTGTAAH